jgi:hypothetical protein
MPRGVHDFDSHNSILFPHVENDLFRDSLINDILCLVVKPDIEEVRFVVVDDIYPFPLRQTGLRVEDDVTDAPPGESEN